MIQQNFGRIVTVSSGSILHGGGAGIAAYAVSKGAARQLTEILADELRKFDIHVHCIMPGTMDTAANRRAMPEADFSQWIRTEDVATVICYLLSEEARAIALRDGTGAWIGLCGSRLIAWRQGYPARWRRVAAFTLKRPLPPIVSVRLKL